MARHSDYDPSYCDTVIALGKEGKTVTQMAAALDVTKQTLHNWKAVHPEFFDAMTRATIHSQAWWEEMGQANLISMPGTSLNGSVYSRSMAARFPDDWRESKGVELTGANGGPVAMVGIDASKLTDEQLRAIASIPLNAG